MGNQAWMSQVERDHGGELWQQAATHAGAGVTQATLALHVEGQGPHQLARLLQIVGRSDLPEARKVTIQERLSTVEAVAQSVSAAVRSAMGVDDDDARLQLQSALDQVSGDLEQGGTVPGGWQTISGETVSMDGEGSRAQQLVRGLGELTELGGTTILAFVQRVHLDLLWDEEEEEEGSGPAVEP